MLPSGSLAVAAKLTGLGNGMESPLDGASRAITGGLFADTLMATAEEVVVAPKLSSATAVRVNEPVGGVQVRVYGAMVLCPSKVAPL